MYRFHYTVQLCDARARGLRKRPGSSLKVQLGFGHVLYGRSECLKGNNTSARKLRETSEHSEEVKLEGKEVKLRWASG